MLTREMGQAYPELIRAEALITETLKLEETRFRATLARGLAILDEKSAGLKKGAMFDGETAFTLYDTYGFPLDLTQDALRARGISVDLAGFDDAMERQREKARASPGRAPARPRPKPSGLRCTRRSAPPNSSATRPKAPKASSPRWSRTARTSTEAEKRRERRGGDEPDAVLRRVAAARSATPARCAASGARDRRHRHAEEGRRRLRASGQGRGGRRSKVGDPLLLEVDHARRVAPSAPTIPPRICCTRRCARCSAITWRRRARWSRPTGCASTSRIPSR